MALFSMQQSRKCHFGTFAPSLNILFSCTLKSESKGRADDMRIFKKLGFIMFLSWLIGNYYNGGIL